MVGGLGTSTHRAGMDERPCVGVHCLPPKVPLQEGQGAIHARVTGKERRMTPQQNLRASRARDKKAIWGAVTRIRFRSLGPPDKGLNLPGDSRHLEAGRREDGVRWSRRVLREKLTREGIRLDVPGSRTVGEDEVEPPKKQGPPGLAGV